ncbi:MAG TPA: hypothetical protein DCE23_00080 [Firmicutes bacterium]|nr:hypothetical protein [Bacillota bacterium]
MNTFSYEAFGEQYNILNKIIGGGETDPSTINGVVANSNRIISEGLEYASDSAWASSKMNEWNNLMPSLKAQLANLATMLQQAKAAADAYNQFEQSHTGIKA